MYRVFSDSPVGECNLIYIRAEFINNSQNSACMGSGFLSEVASVTDEAAAVSLKQRLQLLPLVAIQHNIIAIYYVY
jgi:hypothetical protein